MLFRLFTNLYKVLKSKINAWHLVAHLICFHLQQRAVLSIKSGTWGSSFTCSLTSFPPLFAARCRLSLCLRLHRLFSLCLCRKTDKSSVKHITSITKGQAGSDLLPSSFPISRKIETINSFPLQSTPPLSSDLFYLLYKYES